MAGYFRLASPCRIFQGRCRLLAPLSIWSLVCPFKGPLQDSDPSSPSIYAILSPCCRRNISGPSQPRGTNKVSQDRVRDDLTGKQFWEAGKPLDLLHAYAAQ
ncbi:hypothetical protein FVEG_08149 [Fusarium verticillioides 7600]|uniref:Uncharacterized protein n=1 Tax=Gibberella moniliformis (strain M3125 / FGSC 7600) TaxID=334819 RepID=W7MVA1_GIBM7|nr:hypothetical protein FVEG_08149 [Fusarium verticillioides 7600]EWG48342.1 hypothetical protein FVEG_08149 [Fusarium verticillioides 7600]